MNRLLSLFFAKSSNMLYMCLYFTPDLNIMLIVIRPFDKILGVLQLSLAKLVEKLLRCHTVPSSKNAETLSYSHKSIYRRIILNSLFPHISSFRNSHFENRCFLSQIKIYRYFMFFLTYPIIRVNENVCIKKYTHNTIILYKYLPILFSCL